jgi:short-subunit dehydrogenase
MDLEGKLIVVTGASSGIGQAVAKLAGRAGSQLVLVGRDESSLTETIKLLPPGCRFEPVTGDLTKEADADSIATQVLDKHNTVHALIHAAAEYSNEKIETLNLGSARQTFQLNFWSPVSLSQRLLPAIKAGQGDIVFMSSSAINTPAAGLMTYRASKAAVSSFAESLRQEVNPAGVRVLTIFPGRTATPMQERIHAAEGRHYEPRNLLQPDDVAAAILNAITLPRSAELTEIRIRPMKKTD